MPKANLYNTTSLSIPEELLDFRNFLFMVWKHLNLPEPTPVQYDIADYLVNGPDRLIVEAFRGVGKSWITSALVCWYLLLNPQVKILVVSASKDRADNFTTFTLRLIHEMPILQHLKPQNGQRESKVSFDVGPATPDHAPSVKSVGITGQMAGSRADIIVADDVEVPNNSATQALRDDLSERVKEFDAILKPGGLIRYLGTPQCEMSLYNELQERGYTIRIWPAEYPTPEKLNIYTGKIAPWIYDQITSGSKKTGDAVDPKRFDREDLDKRRLSYGRSGYALQFMLDTSLSDAEKYPLKLNDFIVVSGASTWSQGPVQLQWASGVDQIKAASQWEAMGLIGDRYTTPLFMASEMEPWAGAVMYIDPSGRGKDELSASVVKYLRGNLWVTKNVGFKEGYTPKNMEALCQIAKEQRVTACRVESNFGDGMFTELLKPHMQRIWPCKIEEEHVTGQKEQRIIDRLEPVLNQHRLILSSEVIEEDLKVPDVKYSLAYQLTRITRERGALAHDDRLDSLSGAVNFWTERMRVDDEQAVNDHKAEALDNELRKFMEQVVGAKVGGKTSISQNAGSRY